MRHINRPAARVLWKTALEYLGERTDLLSKEVHGLGFPLACSFLKDAGWYQYPKPDVHTKAILKGIGFADGSDYLTYRAIVTIADRIGETPFSVDKALWLIGSGKLHLSRKRFRTRRQEFVRIAQRALRERTG
jgi:hypothetical protein